MVIAQMMALGYRFGAPTPEAEEIDAQVAEDQRCARCGGSVHYEGYHRRARGCCEYVALAVCDDCGHELAF